MILRLKRNYNLKEASAIKLAQKQYNPYEMRGEELRRKDYIYIDQPTISDLIIREGLIFRRCTDKEWGWFFNTILNPVEEKFVDALANIRKKGSILTE